MSFSRRTLLKASAASVGVIGVPLVASTEEIGESDMTKNALIPDSRIIWPPEHSPASSRVFAQNTIDIAATPAPIRRPPRSMLACSTKASTASTRSRNSWGIRGQPTHLCLGKADDIVEETGESTRCTAGVWDPASKERLSEITSGSSRGQQGLRTTCQDSSNEAKCRSRREPNGSGT